MMTMLLLAALAAQASTAAPAAPQPAAVTSNVEVPAPAEPAVAAPSAAPATPAAEPQAPEAVGGMIIVFFRCDNGRAFTAFEAGRNGNVSTAAGTRYDLRRTRDGYASDAVTYRRQGGRATLTGAANGPYENCVRG